jgi:hypothetical protein
MAMFDAPKAPWPFKWLMIGICTLPFMPVLASLYGAARTGSQEAASGIDSAAADTFQDETVTDEAPRAPEPVRFYWCGDQPPSLDAISAADATPDLYDSPLNRLDCDGWVYPDGSYLLTDAGRELVGLQLSVTPGAEVSIDASGQVIESRTRQPSGEPSTVPSVVPDQAPDDGRSMFGWLWLVLWVGIRVVLFVLGLWLLFVLLRWPWRRLRGTLKARKIDAGGDYVNPAGQRVAFNTPEEAGTSPELLDECPDPPDTPARHLFPVPVGTDDDDDTTPEGWK